MKAECLVWKHSNGLGGCARAGVCGHGCWARVIGGAAGLLRRGFAEATPGPGDSDRGWHSINSGKVGHHLSFVCHCRAVYPTALLRSTKSLHRTLRSARNAVAPLTFCLTAKTPRRGCASPAGWEF